MRSKTKKRKLLQYVISTLILLITKSTTVSPKNYCTSTDGTKYIEDELCKNSAKKSTLKYGIDVSWPMSKLNVTTKVQNPLGDRQKIYNTWMEGCAKTHNKTHCNLIEQLRIDRIKRQPQSMVNYTTNGYAKMRAPDNLYKLIKHFWDMNNGDSNHILENDPGVINQWDSPSYIIHIGDNELIGGGTILMKKIWDEAESVINKWVHDEPLKTTSVYGIRVYTEGSILSPHVDRLPLVSSAIINVAQDVDEEWPLEVIGHDGIATNITMKPGDMILYESHSIIHGRPFSLKGKFYANIFIHFAPIKNDKYTPSYMLEMSPAHVYEINMRLRRNGKIPGYNIAHDAAYHNNLKVLIKLYASSSSQYLTSKDAMGWTPLYYAIAQGHDKVVKFLVTHGCDKDMHASVDKNGKTIFDIANDVLPLDHAILYFLSTFKQM